MSAPSDDSTSSWALVIQADKGMPRPYVTSHGQTRRPLIYVSGAMQYALIVVQARNDADDDDEFLQNYKMPGAKLQKNRMTILWLTNILSQTYDKVTIVPNYKQIL